MLVAETQVLGTNWDVGKPTQAKFYVDEDLWEACKHVLGEQGVNVSEGMSRMCELLVGAGDVLTPLLLRQARGDAAKVLAKAILRGKGTTSFAPSIVAEPGIPLPPAQKRRSKRKGDGRPAEKG